MADKPLLEARATVRSKNRVVIPPAIMDALDAAPDDILLFHVWSDGWVTIGRGKVVRG